MAAEMISAGVLPVLADSPAYDSPPEVHATWCALRGRECMHRVRLCRRLGLPDGKWLKAALMFRAAREAWRARAQGITP